MLLPKPLVLTRPLQLHTGDSWKDGTVASQRTCQRLLGLTLKTCCHLGAAYLLFPSHVGSRPGFTTQCGDSDPLLQADPDLSTTFTRRQRCELYKSTHTSWLLLCSAIHGEGRRENDAEKRAENSGVGANTAPPPRLGSPSTGPRTSFRHLCPVESHVSREHRTFWSTTVTYTSHIIQ